MQLLFEQVLNGVQLGLLLFLMAAGLTLIFGVMDFLNLAHGSLFMIGAYIATTIIDKSGSFFAGLAGGIVLTIIVGAIVERLGLSAFLKRTHLDQVLATYAIILVANDAVRMIWGDSGLTISVPPSLQGYVEIIGVPYPIYRLFIVASGIAVAVGLYILIQRTRLGMIIRASASNGEMAQALGANVPVLFASIFALGAALAAFAGILAAPILTVQSGMGDNILILALVLVVIGGIGSIRGAFVAALLVGLVDTIGRAYIPSVLHLMFTPATASAVSAAVSSMLVYVLLAFVLLLKPEGLLPITGGKR